ncbi:MAG TPA: hypothetical protein VL131_05325 [Gammaproteobacteria bacterium]|nr:hypothetical protein [Gammaproteobacteria bacterium]
MRFTLSERLRLMGFHRLRERNSVALVGSAVTRLRPVLVSVAHEPRHG